MSVSFSTITQRARPKATHIATQAFREALAKLPATTVSATTNGVRVATEENPFCKFATVGLWFETGTRHEPQELNGITRVLTQCSFLGGTENATKAELQRQIDELGGQISVGVDRDFTYIALKVAKENAARAVTLLADIVRNGKTDDATVAAAKKVVQTQRHEFEERPDDLIVDNMFRAAFDSTGAGLGASVWGSEDGINAVTGETVRKFRESTLSGSRCLVVGAGGVSHTELEKAAAAALGSLPRESSASKTAVESRFVGGEVRLWNLRYKLTHILWGFETCGANCEDSLPLALATQLTGAYHRSQKEFGQAALHRTFLLSAHDYGTPGLSYFNEKAIEVMNPFLTQYADAGICGMYIVGRPAVSGPGAADVMQMYWQYSMSEWCRFAQKALHATELDQAKTNLKAQLLFNCDGSANTALDIARQVIYHGRRVPLDEMFARIDDTTANNTQEVLQHYFTGCRPIYSILGYAYPLPAYDYSSMWTYKYWY